MLPCTLRCQGHMLESAAWQQFQTGNLHAAVECAERANEAFFQVYGPMHPSVAKCNRIIGK